MPSKYDAVAVRALQKIAGSGATVIFAAASGAAYDPAADTWAGGADSAVSLATGQAVQIEGDPDRFAALGLILTNPVTLLVAAKGLELQPVPGMVFTWAGTSYTIKDVQATAPDGVPILYTIIGSA